MATDSPHMAPKLTGRSIHRTLGRSDEDTGTIESRTIASLPDEVIHTTTHSTRSENLIGRAMNNIMGSSAVRSSHSATPTTTVELGGQSGLLRNSDVGLRSSFYTPSLNASVEHSHSGTVSRKNMIVTGDGRRNTHNLDDTLPDLLGDADISSSSYAMNRRVDTPPSFSVVPTVTYSSIPAAKRLSSGVASQDGGDSSAIIPNSTLGASTIALGTQRLYNQSKSYSTDPAVNQSLTPSGLNSIATSTVFSGVSSPAVSLSSTSISAQSSDSRQSSTISSVRARLQAIVDDSSTAGSSRVTATSQTPTRSHLSSNGSSHASYSSVGSRVAASAHATTDNPPLEQGESQIQSQAQSPGHPQSHSSHSQVYGQGQVHSQVQRQVHAVAAKLSAIEHNPLSSASNINGDPTKLMPPCSTIAEQSIGQNGIYSLHSSPAETQSPSLLQPYDDIPVIPIIPSHSNFTPFSVSGNVQQQQQQQRERQEQIHSLRHSHSHDSSHIHNPQNGQNEFGHRKHNTDVNLLLGQHPAHLSQLTSSVAHQSPSLNDPVEVDLSVIREAPDYNLGQRASVFSLNDVVLSQARQPSTTTSASMTSVDSIHGPPISLAAPNAAIVSQFSTSLSSNPAHALSPSNLALTSSTPPSATHSGFPTQSTIQVKQVVDSNVRPQQYLPQKFQKIVPPSNGIQNNTLDSEVFAEDEDEDDDPDNEVGGVFRRQYAAQQRSFHMLGVTGVIPPASASATPLGQRSSRTHAASVNIVSQLLIPSLKSTSTGTSTSPIDSASQFSSSHTLNSSPGSDGSALLNLHSPSYLQLNLSAAISRDSNNSLHTATPTTTPVTANAVDANLFQNDVDSVLPDLL